MADTMESGNVYTKQQRIAELARRKPKFRMVSLNQYLDEEWLEEAYRRTRKDGATGVDGVTGADYAAEGLNDKLADLKESAKSGTYCTKCWTSGLRNKSSLC